MAKTVSFCRFRMSSVGKQNPVKGVFEVVTFIELERQHGEKVMTALKHHYLDYMKEYVDSIKWASDQLSLSGVLTNWPEWNKPTEMEAHMKMSTQMTSVFVNVSRLAHSLGNAPEDWDSKKYEEDDTSEKKAAGKMIHDNVKSIEFLARWKSRINEARTRLSRMGDGLDKTRQKFPFQDLSTDAQSLLTHLNSLFLPPSTSISAEQSQKEAE